MHPKRWTEVDKLLQSVLERPTSEREEFLHQACAGDQELEREVRTLLASQKEAGSFLLSPAIDVVAQAMAGERAGGNETAAESPAQIGPYRVLRRLGEGGMGVVYEAVQEHPHRTVALKVVKPGLESSLLRRFEHESQALARLQHPGIAQIYDAGVADTGSGAQPYFAMEFIRGKALREYAEAHTVRERLVLMVKICQAVEHAHRRGLIHRDLKPGNILVDESGQPKILDFGVARVADSEAQVTRQTDVGQLVGTLEYMSPEQVLADPMEIDTRSDVYALGVILYEMLAGRRPYQLSRQLHEAVRTIREEDPAPLSAVSRDFRGDVEIIVAKALEKEKGRRYGSAAALAEDIGHYLADEPIAARRPSAAYQLRKFARRHKALVAGVAAVFVVLAAGVVASTREAIRAGRAQHAAQLEAATAKAIDDFLQNDLLAQASAAAQSDPDLKVRTALDRAAARIGGKFQRQPEVEAAIRTTIGRTYLRMGLYPQGRKQLELTLELQRRVFGATNPETLKTLSRLGSTAYLQGKYSEAEALFNQALPIQRATLGANHADTLYSMNGLANTYFFEGKYEQAEALHSQILEIRRRLLGSEHPDTLASMNNLTMPYEREGKFAQAEALDSRILEIRRRKLGPEHPDTLSSMNNLALIYLDQGKFAQGEALYGQTLEIKRRVLGPEHPETLISMHNLALVYLAEGKLAQAETLADQTAETDRRIRGPENPETLSSMEALADVYTAEGKFAQARILYSHTLEIQRRVLGAEHPDTLYTSSNFGFMYQAEGKYALAEAQFAQTLAARTHTLGSDNPETMRSAADLALAYVSQQKPAAAEPLAREAFEFARAKRPDDWQRFRAESVLGESLAGQKRYADAEPLLVEGYRGMLARQEEIAVPDRYHLERAHDWVVALDRASGRRR